MASSRPVHGVQITFIGPQGKVDVKLVVKKARSCGVAPPPASRDSTAPAPSYGQVENFGGMWTGFTAVVAAGVAGVLTGLALAKRVDYLVDKITVVAKKLVELLASDDVAEAAEDAPDDDAEAAEDERAGDASDDDAEAAEDEDAGDAYDLAFDDEETEDSYALSSEDAPEDEEDPASEIDLAYGDDGGGDDSGGDDDDS